MQGNDEMSLDLRQEGKQNCFAMDVDTWTFPENKRGGRHHSADTQVSLMSSQKKMKQERNEKKERNEKA